MTFLQVAFSLKVCKESALTGKADYKKMSTCD